MSAIQLPGGSLIPGKQVVIPMSTAKTTAFATGGLDIVGLILPATFTGTSISFEVSSAIDGTFVPLYNVADNSLVSFTITQNRSYAVDPTLLRGFAFMKIVSQATEGAARTITLTLKG